MGSSAVDVRGAVVVSSLLTDEVVGLPGVVDGLGISTVVDLRIGVEEH